jgi:hypothetical protein
MDEKLRELIELHKRDKKPFANTRLLYITEQEFVWFYYGSYTEQFYTNLWFVRNLGFHRGQILDVFSRLELVINELIQLQILGFNAENAQELDKLLEKVNLSARARLLNQWDIIDNALFEKIIKVNDVRNKFAHVWDEKEVTYVKKYTKETIKQSPFRLLLEDIASDFENNEPITVKTSIQRLFKEFKQDFEDVWQGLIDAYKHEQNAFDLDALIRQVQKG